MALFLPHRCWLLTAREGVSIEESAWPIEMDGVNWNLLEEPENQAVLAGGCDVEALRADPRVVSIDPVWVFTSEDPVELPEEHGGRYEQVCAGSSLISTDRDLALRDLARVAEPVRQLLEVCAAGPAVARPLARRVLDGDLEALAVLADALEEAGDPLAGGVRALI